ncbi:hypothetical protein ISCGN_018774 [Ixodes scapularis]
MSIVSWQPWFVPPHVTNITAALNDTKNGRHEARCSREPRILRDTDHSHCGPPKGSRRQGDTGQHRLCRLRSLPVTACKRRRTGFASDTFPPPTDGLPLLVQLAELLLLRCAADLVMSTLCRRHVKVHLVLLRGRAVLSSCGNGVPDLDVLLQIKEDILDRISCTTTRAVLALDIKGAFDNVSHTLVFENLASTGCGPRMYDYVRDFLSNWMATIGIESIRTSTIPIPSKGNRQGSVLSPTFGRQDFLEEVIETVQNYLEAGNLQRAPDKSQLLLLRAGKPIPEEEEGGHPPHRDGGAKYTVDRLVKTTTQVMRMVRRITSHRHGLEESDLIRLTQPLVVSHIACANPYLNLLSRGKGKMDVIIRKGY